VRVIGVCTGSFILASAGLMKQRTACVSWLHHNEYVDRFPDHKITSDQLYVEDREIITCAGGSAVADLAASLVRRHVGNNAEKNALQILQIERRREGREVQPRNPLATDHRDSKVRKALIFMENNIDQSVSMEQVADAIGLSRRQMERLFHRRLKLSPGAVYTRLKMRRARTLVLQTSKPLIDIALDIGFENSSHFGRKFRELFGHTPNALRKTQKEQGFVKLEDDLFDGIDVR
jgi:transcriptional regulator GlxA family with amidase domain